jgi:hypothetical protein
MDNSAVSGGLNAVTAAAAEVMPLTRIIQQPAGRT